MDQLRISHQLKAITGIIAALGLGIFTLMLVSYLTGNGTDHGLSLSMIVMFAITLIVCLLVLVQFWKVCTQIGLENSFSSENVRSFAIMSRLLLILTGIWIGYAVGRLFVIEDAGLYTAVRPFVFTAVWGIVSALAGALSKLIEKARQIREENDLTI